MNTKNKTLFITQFSILLALEAIVCFTPLGSIPIGPIVATLMYIPVIVTAILLGTAAGAAMGFAAGLFSFIVWTFMPPFAPMAFVFTPFYNEPGLNTGNIWSLAVCFVPRVLVGIAAGLSFKYLHKFFNGKKEVIAYFVSGLAASLTATVLVLGGIYIFFGRPYADLNAIGFDLLLGALGMVVLTNGIPEALIGGVTA